MKAFVFFLIEGKQVLFGQSGASGVKESVVME